MKTRKSIGFGFGSAVTLAFALAGFGARASAQTASLSGSVQGGVSAVSGAVVTLYMAGAEYGANATSLGQATTDSGGNFTIGYTPPATPAVLYLVALGGNAGAGTNTAIGLLGVAGMSNALPVTFKLNERTTVAAEWALAQFIDPTGQVIGTPASNAIGLANAANQTQDDLVDIATGSPASFWTTYGVSTANCKIAVPPVNCAGIQRLDTVANILAACVASPAPPSSPCRNLLSHTNGSATTLGAAHYLATNPFLGHDVFVLQSSSPPFTPVLSKYNDWEIPLTFAPSGANFQFPQGVAMDAAGNVWMTNFDGGSVTELTPSGSLVGNFAPSGANFNGPNDIAIDDAGNVWVTNASGNSVTELTATGSLVGNFAPGGANFNAPWDLAIDAAANVWVTNEIGNSVTELTSNGGLAGNFAPSGANLDNPEGVAIDVAGNVWVANHVGISTISPGSVTELTASGGLAGNFAPSGAHFNGPAGVAIDAVDNVWVTNRGGSNGSVTEFTSNGNLVGNFAQNSIEPGAVAVDGAGNVWVSHSGRGFLPPGVTELTSSGAVAGYFAPNGTNFTGPQGVAIDGSGNVWVANQSGGATGSGDATELIGLARPVLTPIVACLKQSPPHAVCLP